jgi:cation diffusion facilitator CzcD-associated flavoprotein CzcO
MTRVVVVGGGFGGLIAAIRLTEAGHDVTVFEKSEGLGGVWQANTYPGAACDIPSHLYELSFAPNPNWSRRFAPQAEIAAYVEDVAQRYGVRDRFRTGVEVHSAQWSDSERRWTVQTSQGPIEADVVVTACGQLRAPSVPPIRGLDSFAGPAFHTAEWDHSVDLAGTRVAVIGTGCSAIQVVPAIADRTASLTVFQRSPGWTLPKNDTVFSERTKRMYRRFPVLQRLDRKRIWWFQELAAIGMTRLPLIRRVARIGTMRQIKSAIKDPVLRAKVTPRDEVGCKRVMLTDEWYPTLARPDVHLVTDRIAEIVPEGVRTADGTLHEFDVLIYATGFKSHEFIAPMEVVGVGGRTLAEHWRVTPTAYLGLTMPSFPNLFLIYGPNTNGGTGSVLFTLECAVQHVVSALDAMAARGAARIEVKEQVDEDFQREIRTKLAGTVWHTGCENWYVDEHGNDPNQWPYRFGIYQKRTATVGEDAYEFAG